jgi:kumamolisin
MAGSRRSKLKIRLVQSIGVAVVVSLFGFAGTGLAQDKTKAPTRGAVESPEVRAVPTPKPPVVTQSLLMTAPGTKIIPGSSIPKPAIPGQPPLAHTNIEVFLPSGLSPEAAPPFADAGYETPASIACHYNLVSTSAAPGCNPNTTTVNPSGGSGSIAIVDAYDDPTAPSDLAYFSLQFGIPLTLSQFHVVWANTADSSCNFAGVGPDYSGGWELEESLDIEWAHAMAPGANLYLVEACTNSYNDLFQAVSVATNLVQCGHTEINSSTLALGTCPSVTSLGIVSMSWGSGEFSTETTFDGYFNQYGVEYFASAGDAPGVSYPCASVNVICAGGTTIRRDNGTNGLPVFNFLQEAAWVDGGGGISAYEPLPAFQSGTSSPYTDAAVLHCVDYSATRCVPDLSFDADPYTGVYVYDTFGVDFIDGQTWFVVGGTSVASPSLSGIADVAETVSGFTSTPVELSYIYSLRGNSADFTNIGVGFCGPYMGSSQTSGWTFCNGIGVVNGYGGE